jgi:hypothetical protein
MLLSSSTKGRINIHKSVFEQGFDSMSAAFLRNQVVAALQISESATGLPRSVVEELPSNLVFSYAAISDLAKYIVRMISFGGCGDPAGALDAEKVKVIESSIARLSSGFVGLKHVGLLITPAVVLITGTTGSLGSFLLASLLKNDRVQRVYAFNRRGTKPSKQRQTNAFLERDLPVNLLNGDKVIFVEGDTAAENLGLSSLLYEEV